MSSNMWLLFVVLAFLLPMNNWQQVHGSPYETKNVYYVWPDGARGDFSEEKIRSLQVRMKVPEESVGLQTPEISICLRVRLQNTRRSCLFDVAAIRFFFMDPFRGYGFVEYRGRYFTFVTNKMFKPRQYFHLCLSLNNTAHGTEFKMKWNDITLVDDTYLGKEALPANFTLGQYFDFGACFHFNLANGLPTNMTGELADIQVFQRALGVSEMEEYTANCQNVDGKAVANLSLSSVGQYVFEQKVHQSLVCESNNNNYHFPLVIQRRLKYDKAKHICNFLGGSMLHPLLDKNGLEAMINITIHGTSIFGREDCGKMFWVPFVQEDKNEDTENVTRKTYKYRWYRDSDNPNDPVKVKDEITDIQPWGLSQPNGLNFQQCLGISLDEDAFGFYDLDCQIDTACMICSIPSQDKFTLRGLDTKLDVDRHYKLNYYYNPMAPLLYFSGYNKDSMAWDWDTDTLIIMRINLTKIVTHEKQGPPFGQLSAKVFGKNSNYTKLIKFTRVTLRSSPPL